MKILGLYDGHNATAVLLEDGKILAAVEEERLSRIKFHDGRYDGPPHACINEVFRLTNTHPSEIDMIAIPLLDPISLTARVWGNIAKSKNLHWAFFFANNFGNWGPLYYFSPFDYQNRRKKNILQLLKDHGLQDKPIFWSEHHMAHCASAYYTSNLSSDVLAVCFDGKGDGLSGQACLGSEGRLKVLDQTIEYHSIGLLYSAITEYLGFRPLRHEGKITGLAAFADWNNPAYDILKQYASFNSGAVRLNAIEKLPVKPYPWLSTRDLLPKIRRDFDGKNIPREQIASAVQKVCEDLIVKYISYWINKTGVTDLALSGGVFSNVKINQRIMEIPKVSSIFIHPAMGDAGLAAGAAFLCQASSEGLKPFELTDVYFGMGYSKAEIEHEISKYKGIEYYEPANIAKETGQMIADGKVVARFDGRMEYGPRALGNRTIMYDPQDPQVNKWLNDRLNRTEFMPFAPVALEEHAEELYFGLEKARYPARFMTISLDTTPFAKQKAAAVTHVDGTARPQLIKESYNPTYYRILKAFYSNTGIPCCVNTSFNMHEEPIVGSPYDAVRSFLMGRLDVLSIGDFMVTMNSNEKRAKRVSE